MSQKPYYRFGEVKELLGLTNWQIHLAEENGWLKRTGKPIFEAQQILNLLESPEDLHYKIWLYESINANKAAEFLNINRPQFDWLVKQKLISPYEQGEFQYGIFYLYRRVDLKSNQDIFQQALQDRKKQQAQTKKQGIKKAQQTRKQNSIIKQKVKQTTDEIFLLTELLSEQEKQLAQTVFWLRLTSAYADIDRKSKSRKVQKSSSVLLEAKSQALHKLCLAKSPFVTKAFVDQSFVMLCDDCIAFCSSVGIPFEEHGGCWRCFYDHQDSLVEIKTRGIIGEAQFFIPYNSAKKWQPKPENEAFVQILIDSDEPKKPKGFPSRGWKNLCGPWQKEFAVNQFVHNHKAALDFYKNMPKDKVVDWIGNLPLHDPPKSFIDHDIVNDTALQKTYPRKIALQKLMQTL